jgi:hypothetical protein
MKWNCVCKGVGVHFNKNFSFIKGREYGFFAKQDERRLCEIGPYPGIYGDPLYKKIV